MTLVKIIYSIVLIIVFGFSFASTATPAAILTEYLAFPSA